MIIQIYMETSKSYEYRKLVKDREPELYEVSFAFRDILLESFMVDDFEDDLTFTVRGATYKCSNTEENRNKLSYVINNTTYES